METHIFCHVSTKILAEIFEEKVTGKVGECIFDT